MSDRYATCKHIIEPNPAEFGARRLRFSADMELTKQSFNQSTYQSIGLTIGLHLLQIVEEFSEGGGIGVPYFLNEDQIVSAQYLQNMESAIQ